MGGVPEQKGGQDPRAATERKAHHDAQEVEILWYSLEHEVPAALQVAAPQRAAHLREDGLPAADAQRDIAGAQGGQRVRREPGPQWIQAEKREEKESRGGGVELK